MITFTDMELEALECLEESLEDIKDARDKMLEDMCFDEEYDSELKKEYDKKYPPLDQALKALQLVTDIVHHYEGMDFYN